MSDSLSAPDYVFLKCFLRDRIGHDLGEGKEYLVVSRLAPVVNALGLSSLADLFLRLRRACDPAVASTVCEAMVTCETSFFRNVSAFDRLRVSVIPALMSVRKTEKTLRIWSAGCSTGQEPYSIAILLVEHFPELRGWDVRIVATDLSDRALRQAEQGDYSEQEIRRGLSDVLRRTYFSPNSQRWMIDPAIRRLVSFEKLNLNATHLPMSTFDLIFIRNVLIYFATECRASVYAMLRRSIQDDGYLFLGESETILGQGDSFTFAEDGMDYYRPARF